MQCASIERLTGLLAFSRENVHASHVGAIVEENLDRAEPIFLPDFRFAVTLSRGFTVATYIYRRITFSESSREENDIEILVNRRTGYRKHPIIRIVKDVSRTRRLIARILCTLETRVR